MREVTSRQFFGRSPRYQDACVELRFGAPDAPTPLSWLEHPLRQLLPGWRSSLPEAAPIEEAVALVAQPLMERRMPAWVRYGREGDEASIALGSGDARLAHFVLSSLHRLLTCPPAERTQAWQQFENVANAVEQQKAVNFGVMAAARAQDIETTWINPPRAAVPAGPRLAWNALLRTRQRG